MLIDECYTSPMFGLVAFVVAISTQTSLPVDMVAGMKWMEGDWKSGPVDDLFGKGDFRKTAKVVMANGNGTIVIRIATTLKDASESTHELIVINTDHLGKSVKGYIFSDFVADPTPLKLEWSNHTLTLSNMAIPKPKALGGGKMSTRITISKKGDDQWDYTIEVNWGPLPITQEMTFARDPGLAKNRVGSLLEYSSLDELFNPATCRRLRS